jgi:PPOX class probable F420-dependent enzyme
VTDRPVTDRPLTDRPLTDRPLTDRPLTDRPVTDRAGASTVGRQAVAMSQEEVTEFLALPLTMSLATNGSDGWPHVVAMWYGFLDGVVGFLTYRNAQKYRNIQRDPRVSCLVEDGRTYDELRGVLIRGRVEQVDDEGQRLVLATSVTERYQGPLDRDGVASVRREISKRIALRVRVNQVVSWDHRKLVTTRQVEKR